MNDQREPRNPVAPPAPVRGGVFDPSLPDGRGVATLRVEGDALVAVVDGRDEPFALPLSGAATVPSGQSLSLVTFFRQRHAVMVVPAVLPAIL